MKDTSMNITGSTGKRLISDEQYFKSIFKKTEKIVCAVSYIVHKSDEQVRESVQARDLDMWALETLSATGEMLLLSREAFGSVAHQLASKMVLLESKLRVFYTIGGMQVEHLNVFVAEIDTVLRSLRDFDMNNTEESMTSLFREETSSKARHTAPAQRRVSEGRAKVAKTDSAQNGDRRDRIKAVLIAEQKASIKDITDTIKDCSEKTIQRELTTMIKDGLVLREGERRWSTYSYIGQ
ncbi:hypothetical protein GW943_03325 [Candidatus Parcubacteria bacterium]|uniref:HTH deoR-type domain-containing protein n=1 Tax=Candidatus Kaiserbacteria bacterium CG10_big_fil_rev_8_21_14_0_10_47_16 TaxID=1974608 RepID=A0A2H0UEP6_9BACT|nr:hypothetical protein [Candidatus Parcubacteria bacterium]PIR84830.1 MAG: hypothetical protein COU16_00375 [Candidatus Kaiserbacteria bacterium CG10_big_fil_rev_8_21_14_0_10_47_16]